MVGTNVLKAMRISVSSKSIASRKRVNNNILHIGLESKITLHPNVLDRCSNKFISLLLGSLIYETNGYNCMQVNRNFECFKF